jgi:hypothetical protein
MNAAGVLPHFTGIAVHDASARYDTRDQAHAAATPTSCESGRRSPITTTNPAEQASCAGPPRPPTPHAP